MRAGTFIVGAAVWILFGGCFGCRKATTPAVAAKPLQQTQVLKDPVQPRELAKSVVVQYSSMFVHPETGDILGWDVKMTQSDDGYDLTIFCGEGAPIGPVRGRIASLEGSQLVQLEKDICGSPMTAEFKRRGMFLKVGDNEREFIPRHKNFFKQELFK